MAFWRVARGLARGSGGERRVRAPPGSRRQERQGTLIQAAPGEDLEGATWGCGDRAAVRRLPQAPAQGAGRVVMDRQQPGGVVDFTTCEAQVEQLERGVPLAGMTLAESIADLTSLAVAGDWRTPGERERARRLVLRLASLGWRADADCVRSGCPG
jgi:hypothetical protein